VEEARKDNRTVEDAVQWYACARPKTLGKIPSTKKKKEGRREKEKERQMKKEKERD
jgi:hypothetical protein